MFKKILFPTDFSDCAIKTTDFAVSFALFHNAELIFCHVVKDSEDSSEYSTLKNEVELKLEDLKLKKGLDTDSLKWDIVTLFGHSAAEEIIEYIDEKENAIDLIIIPSHGKTGFKKFLIGSTAERIIRHSKVPVLNYKKHLEL